MPLFWTREKALKLIKQEENAVANAKNGQIKAMSKIIEQQQEYIDSLLNQLNEHKAGTMEEKLADAAIQMFMPKPQQSSIPTSPPQTVASHVVESGQVFNDNEIISVLSKVPRKRLKQQIAQGQQAFINEVKNQIPDISQESAERSFELAKMVI